MSRLVQIIAVLFMIICCCECHKNWEFAENIPYSRIYSVNTYSLTRDREKIDIIPVCGGYDALFDKESRSFYSALDTNLSFTGRRLVITNSRKEMECWCAVDLRISAIDIFALEEFDDTHPAETSLNDLCQLWYTYKHCKVIRPLTDVQDAGLMLVDYYPYNEGFAEVISLYLFPSHKNIPALKFYPETGGFLNDNNDIICFPKIVVRITDTFGKEFSYILDNQ
ncbi:MAG: hypothetical protein IKX71_03085 [Bacteroidales bacterium]|nr:hypothetical protein [Bacteroidales bacterium]